MTLIPYYLPSSFCAWSVVKVANVLCMFFDFFQKLCKGDSLECDIYLLLTLKRCIHLRSSHGIDMQRQNHSQKRGCNDSTFLAKWLKEEIACSEMTYLTVNCCDHACLPYHTLCFSWKLDRCAKHNSGINKVQRQGTSSLPYFNQLTAPKTLLSLWSNLVSLSHPREVCVSKGCRKCTEKLAENKRDCEKENSVPGVNYLFLLIHNCH